MILIFIKESQINTIINKNASDQPCIGFTHSKLQWKFPRQIQTYKGTPCEIAKLSYINIMSTTEWTKYKTNQPFNVFICRNSIHGSYFCKASVLNRTNLFFINVQMSAVQKINKTTAIWQMLKSYNYFLVIKASRWKHIYIQYTNTFRQTNNSRRIFQRQSKIRSTLNINETD